MAHNAAPTQKMKGNEWRAVGSLVPYLHEKLTSSHSGQNSGSNGDTEGVRAEGEEVDLRHD